MTDAQADHLVSTVIPPSGVSGRLLRTTLEAEGMDGREITMAVARAFDSGAVRLGPSMWIYPNEVKA